MKLRNKAGRTAEVEVELGASSCDTFLASGYWLDTMEPCTEPELDELREWNGDKIADYDMAWGGGWRD